MSQRASIEVERAIILNRLVAVEGRKLRAKLQVENMIKFRPSNLLPAASISEKSRFFMIHFYYARLGCKQTLNFAIFYNREISIFCLFNIF